MVTSGYSIQPLTVHTWDVFAGLVERHNGIFGGCWCTYFHPERAEREPGYEGSRALKKQLVEAGEVHAALVMIDDEAVAWAEYGTPDELPNIHHRKQYLAEADVTPDYRITCIFVDKRYRRQGYDPAGRRPRAADHRGRCRPQDRRRAGVDQHHDRWSYDAERALPRRGLWNRATREGSRPNLRAGRREAGAAAGATASSSLVMQ